MPETNRHDIDKLVSKKTNYFPLFLLSLLFIVLSLFAYNYTSQILSKQLTTKSINDIYTTTTPQARVTPIITSVADASPSAQAATPTPDAPYLKTYQNDDLNFKVDYLSTRTLFEDSSSIESRFVFTNPQGNFVVHVGTKDFAWTHSGRKFSDKLLLLGHQTFVYDTTSQKVIDIKTDDGKFYTIQCVHNGIETLIDECDQFIQSFKFLTQPTPTSG